MCPKKVRKVDLFKLGRGDFSDLDDGSDEHIRLRKVFNPYLIEMYHDTNPLIPLQNYLAEILSQITLKNKKSKKKWGWTHRPDETIIELDGTYTFIEFHTAKTDAIEKIRKWKKCVEENFLYFGKPSNKTTYQNEVMINKIIFVLNPGQLQKIKGRIHEFQTELFNVELFLINAKNHIQKIKYASL